MKIHLLLIVGTSLYYLISNIPVSALTENALATKYYSEFNTHDGTGAMIAGSNFIHEVPVETRANILADILNRAISEKNHLVMQAIIVFLIGGDGGARPAWNERLTQSVFALENGSDWNTKTLLVDLLSNRKERGARSIILALQTDPDDRVRFEALRAVAKWPDAVSIYQTYIQVHQGDPSYARAVRNAQSRMQRVRESMPQ
jgi:hypothetical protein